MTAPTALARSLLASRAVLAVFALDGFLFAAWVSRLPAVRDALDLTPSALGVILLIGISGSLVSLPLTGAIVERFGSAPTTRTAAVVTAVGFAAAASSVPARSVVLLAAGLFVASAGFGSWDVSMNIQGAHVEQQLGRSVMPRFHAAFSLGSVVGAGWGALASGLGLSVPVSVIGSAVAAASLVAVAVTRYLPDPVAPGRPPAPEGATRPDTARPHPLAAWREVRTVLVGIVVLASSVAEGSATDWLALAVVDGFGTSNAVGALSFAAFVTAMTGARLVGTRLLDRFGRVAVLRACALVGLAGIVLFTTAPNLPLAVVGILAWGFGSALGFPVGMSAAADDPARSAARVSVVSTIGYMAFLGGPPLLGLLADQVGYRSALLAVAGPLVLAFFIAHVTRPVTRDATASGG